VSDIVDRLRRGEGLFPPYSVRNDAADRIEALEAENVRLRNQLDAARTGKALLALEAAEAEYQKLLSRWSAVASRLVDEMALCDQLAEALRAALLSDDDAIGTCDAALAAYEAARKEGA
jgi:hypothetical protein